MERLFKNSPRILYPRFDSRKRRHVMSKQTNNKACQGSRHYWSLLGGRLTCGGVTSASRRRRLMPAFSHRGHVASRGCNADNVTKMRRYTVYTTILHFPERILNTSLWPLMADAPSLWTTWLTSTWEKSACGTSVRRRQLLRDCFHNRCRPYTSPHVSSPGEITYICG